jgi:predicted MFS family arabinose efflux permease
MVNIAFPDMASSLAIAPEGVRWVIIGYVGCYAVMSFVGGAAADRVGSVHVFRVGLGVTAVGLLAAALAPTAGWLLAGRVVQGLGSGCVYGTAPGIVSLAVAPGARGRALGRLNAVIALALSVGAPLAGVLVDAAGWRAVFLVRVPLAAGVLVWALWVRAPAGAGARPRLVSPRDVLRPAVLLSGLLAFGANAGIFAIWLLAPFYLVTQRALDATVAGWLFMLTPLGTTVAAPLAGRVADRTGMRPPMVAGLALEAAALFALSHADVATPVAVVALALLGAGFGLGFFQVPNMTAVMVAFPPTHQGAAGGFAFLARTLGVATGVSILAQVFAERRAVAGFEPAFAEAVTVAALVVASAAGLAAVKLTSPRTVDRRR